ncbi:MAG: rhomboid family intramembrane serine protease [Firmicutes bacterium]|nr:rhomboid family intramembrane serine protease [Bacillota bacterium]MDD7227909.1 rhomboid family intramembrane serine protease [Bacillota bacterium]MDY4972484.1 rhomboid family intramembrane serine protease [Erysipelotrichaceae bacterium]
MLKLYQLALYFVSKFNYRIVEVKNLNNEIWLCNKKHKTYPIIRLSINTTDEPESHIQLQQKIKNSIVTTLNCNNNYLDIHIRNNEKAINDKMVVIDENYYDGIDVTSYFPDIKKQIHMVKDQGSEMNRILNEFKNINNGAKKKSIFDSIKKGPYVTYIVALICVLVYLISLYFYRYTDNSSEVAIIIGGYYKIFVVAGQWWRIFTAGFVHVDVFHLLVNMLSLISLGRLLENYYGHIKFLIVLLVGIVFGNLFLFALNDNIVAVGISGGLYALLACLAMYIYNTKMYKIPAVMHNVIYIFLVNLMINLLPSIGYYAHLGGFIAGILLAFIFTKNSNWVSLKNNTIIVGIILCIVLGYKCMTNTFINTLYAKSDMTVIETYNSLGLKETSLKLFIRLNTIYEETK